MIKVRDFHKSFGNKMVHKGVSFEVETGECLGLIGGSGVGKSVILRSLIGLERPDQGFIEIDGTLITGLSERELVDIRKKVAYIFQGGALFDSMTVFENLAYPIREHSNIDEVTLTEKVLQQLRQFGLQGSEYVYPAQLSGGMQKRVGIARAMMMNPEFVLYDEPTAGLDPFNTKKIQELILHLKSTGVTSILVTHDMPTAMAVCDRLVFLLNGRIEAQGTLAEVKSESNPLIKKFIDGEAS